MRKMTEANLSSAFAGESQAHMKYQIFADRAEGEYPNLARLFRAIAYAERVHATNHLEALGGVGGTLDNLQAAFDGETFEVEEMYPAFFEVAKLQEEKVAMRSIVYAKAAEKVHAGMYQQAKAVVSSGADLQIAGVQVCPVCGHTVIGEPPDKCPVCTQPGSSFKKF
ncbi:MAG: rubrerythrin family protein [Chloroflexi bacterium]|nr:rubrerythrin family protein [Chloroflexota bacterium]